MVKLVNTTHLKCVTARFVSSSLSLNRIINIIIPLFSKYPIKVRIFILVAKMMLNKEHLTKKIRYLALACSGGFGATEAP